MVSKLIIEKYGRRMIKGNNPNWRPKMPKEPTVEISEPNCLFCNDTGYVWRDIGGGDSVKELCECEAGQELKKEEKDAESWWESWREAEYRERNEDNDKLPEF